MYVVILFVVIVLVGISSCNCVSQVFSLLNVRLCFPGVLGDLCALCI